MSSHDDDLPEVIDAEVVDGDVLPDGIGGPGAPGAAGFDLGSMMQMAQDMQQQVAQAQEALASTNVEGSAGGGVVKVTLNGHLHLVGLDIDAAAVESARSRLPGARIEVADGLTSFIQTWLVDHVNNFDREFVGHFLDKGIDPHASPVTRKPPA